MDQLPGGYLTNASRADYASTAWFVHLPAGVKLGDLFNPRFWAHHTRILKKHDLLRVRAEDGSFDFELTVVELRQGGVLMEAWPKMPAAIEIAEATEVAPVQIADGSYCPRIEYKKVTKWRVIGQDNNESMAGIETKPAAVAALIKYMADIGYSNNAIEAHLETLGLTELVDKAA